MYNKIRKEVVWIIIFIVTQLGLFLYNYREFETLFLPVVGPITIETSEQVGQSSRVFVSFDKLRACTFIGLRMTDPYGSRVKFKFMDEDTVNDDSYLSRPSGLNVAGPWLIEYLRVNDLQIEAIHKCDWFGYTVSLMQHQEGQYNEYRPD